GWGREEPLCGRRRWGLSLLPRMPVQAVPLVWATLYRWCGRGARNARGALRPIVWSLVDARAAGALVPGAVPQRARGALLRLPVGLRRTVACAPGGLLRGAGAVCQRTRGGGVREAPRGQMAPDPVGIRSQWALWVWAPRARSMRGSEATVELEAWVMRHRGEGPLVLLGAVSGVMVRLARAAGLSRQARFVGWAQTWELFEGEAPKEALGGRRAWLGEAVGVTEREKGAQGGNTGGEARDPESV